MPQLEVNRYNCNLRFVIFVVQHCGTCLMQPLLSRLSSFTGVWIEIQLSIESCTDQQMCPTLKSSYQNHRKYLSGTLCTFKEPTTSHHTRTYLLQGWRGAAVFDWSKWQQSDSCLTARRTSVLSGPRPPNSIHSFILIEWHDRERERQTESEAARQALRESEIITVSTDSSPTSPWEKEKMKGNPASGMLHYILLKEQHIVQVGLVESTAVHWRKGLHHWFQKIFFLIVSEHHEHLNEIVSPLDFLCYGQQL